MNIEFLQTLVVEELRNLCDADSQLSEMLPKMERASLSPEVAKAISCRRELEKSQTDLLVGQILSTKPPALSKHLTNTPESRNYINSNAYIS